MNLRKVIPIYNNEMYLYEIIEDYKEASTPDEQDEIFSSFCSLIWSCTNKRKIYTKKIHFKVRKDLLTTDLGQTFHHWSALEYQYYRSKTMDKEWFSIIRQKVNNIYTRYFDSAIILDKEYMELLKTPKRLYYDWVSGSIINIEAITTAIETSNKVKERLQKEKMILSWEEYKKVMEGFLRTALNNCKLIEDYEDKDSIHSRLNFFTEDHFYVGYINKYIAKEILQYQKRYYGIRPHKNYGRCIDCHGMFEKNANNQKRCPTCQQLYTRKSKTAKQQKYRVEKQKTQCNT